MSSVTNLILKAADAESSTCDSQLPAEPWEVDQNSSYGPGASHGDDFPTAAPRQGVLPERYTTATPDELDAMITTARETLGDRVKILGHFYQRDEIVKFADFVGDSFNLAQAAKAHPEAEAFVFCGVHFMAETADILSQDNQAVILPNLSAGCSMADMANISQVEACWEELSEVLGTNGDVAADGAVADKAPLIPVTYMNSAADIKAFCGRNGGIVCTSSNARTVLDWVFERGERVVFLPDQHLGRNTARAMGIPDEQIIMWHPHLPLGGNTAEEIRAAKVILWNGFCSVHKRFTVAQIEKARAEFPGVRVVVHPECPAPVVDAADVSGSTEVIRREVEASKPGDVIAIGTEINMVNRLAQQYPDRTIFCLDPVVCPCSTMYRIHPAYLAYALESLVDGKVVNQITVDESVAEHAEVALERMLAAKPH
ncbi:MULTISPECIES: quinolinate synthase NadA [unclassified Corynebacterium]|uniref:quinolinate synthase NadA n=1 Tax=unclassified Corynebacterium TaxID=2624378 RepID=UPI0008A29805|nr:MULTISPECIES: quinolinate synthase NadA [unclassified Corynebacterium]MDK8791608.1 quinolinate synthase NadA [Corynebacterium sp. MSK039]OFS16981.1 quinolinate synthase [Corynebacterium sp. HMSC27B11]